MFVVLSVSCACARPAAIITLAMNNKVVFMCPSSCVDAQRGRLPRTARARIFRSQRRRTGALRSNDDHFEVLRVDDRARRFASSPVLHRARVEYRDSVHTFWQPIATSSKVGAQAAPKE